MKLKKLALRFLLAPFATALLSVAASPLMAQMGADPCDPRGLIQPGTIVYDAHLGVCWLADANLAGRAAMRAAFGVPGINPNGTMDFLGAQNWVAAMNNGTGYLGHTDWQLPVTPPNDGTCASFGGGGGFFGPDCTGSAMGSIDPAKYPDSVAPGFGIPVTQAFQDLKLSYYWTQKPIPAGGQEVFAFSSGKPGGVTTLFPYYYVLPMVYGWITGGPTCPAGFAGVLPYTSGPAAYQAVYDCNTYTTWAADGNLAARNTFGISGNLVITSNRGTALRVPKIDRGAMLFATANDMITAMRNNGPSGYLGSSAWQLPPDAGYLTQFAQDLGLAPGDSRLRFTGNAGLFQNLQPFYYWGCQQTQPATIDQTGMTESPCTSFAPASGGQQMQWTFNFDDGFTGTAETSQKFFVMAYFPVPLAQQCSNPMQCCMQAGGYWSKNHCE